MEWSLMFFVNSVLLGVGLAMDAFSVSLANGLHEPRMRKWRMGLIAGTFGGFQFLMPFAGWLCIHRILELFNAVRPFIPWIALLLLCYIGGKMVISGIRNEENAETAALWFGALLLQGIATSLDALSVGFTIAEYSAAMALVCSLIIGVVTFFICIAGLMLGRRFGLFLANKASIFGGVILIAIGLEIFLS